MKIIIICSSSSGICSRISVSFVLHSISILKNLKVSNLYLYWFKKSINWHQPLHHNKCISLTTFNHHHIYSIKKFWETAETCTEED